MLSVRKSYLCYERVTSHIAELWPYTELHDGRILDTYHALSLFVHCIGRLSDVLYRKRTHCSIMFGSIAALLHRIDRQKRNIITDLSMRGQMNAMMRWSYVSIGPNSTPYRRHISIRTNILL